MREAASIPRKLRHRGPAALTFTPPMQVAALMRDGKTKASVGAVDIDA